VSTDATSPCSSTFAAYKFSTDRFLTALSPAVAWVGLKNGDDVGTRFDMKAEVYKDNILIGSGQLNGVAGGSSGFNKAVQSSIPLTLSSPVGVPSGTVLSLKVFARITCSGRTHATGTARLWFNDAQARSRFGVTIDGVRTDDFLRKDFALGSTQGIGPKITIDKVLDSKIACSAPGGRTFTSFGTWSTTLP